MTSKEFKQQVLPLAERLYPMVARMLGGHENAEDAVQDIMLKLWQERKKVARHPNMKGLIFTTARNHCLDRLRRKKLIIQPYDAILQDQKHLTSHDVELTELNKIIEEILQELPDNQASVLTYRDLDQMEFAEISAVMDLKVENVRMLLSRARKKIREKIIMIYSYESKERKSTGS